MGRKVDPAIAALASVQHGLVTAAQLAEAGIGSSGISKRVQRGTLHRLHRGVYAVGHTADSWQRRWMAAVLASGNGAALSHRSAASLWGLLRPHSGPIEVVSRTRSGRSPRTGILLHRPRTLRAYEIVSRHRIPVTTPARTIDDLRDAVPARDWRRAVRQAELAKMRLNPQVKTDRTRSDLEQDFLRICLTGGLPRPEVNVKVGRWTVDSLWRAERLAVEVDSYLYHRGRIAFQDDHARDLDLRRAGLQVRRFDEVQIETQPELVLADLRDALQAAKR
jgi:hypothetical protein